MNLKEENLLEKMEFKCSNTADLWVKAEEKMFKYFDENWVNLDGITFYAKHEDREDFLNRYKIDFYNLMDDCSISESRLYYEGFRFWYNAYCDIIF